MPAVTTFNKPISAMKKKDLQLLAAAFNLPADRGVKQLRTDLKHYISAHKEDLQADPAYRRIFPSQRGRRARAPTPAASERGSRSPSPAIDNPNLERRGDSEGFRETPADDANSGRGWGSWRGVHSRRDSEAPDPMHAGGSVMNDDAALHHLRSMDPATLARLIQEAQRGSRASTPFPDAYLDSRNDTLLQTVPQGLHPKRQRPARQRGLMAAGADHIIPDHIRKRFADGWLIHVPLTYLTDAYCSRDNFHTNSTSLHSTISFDEGSNQLFSLPKPLSSEGELSLSFEDWELAWRRLISLIDEFIPAELQDWEIHYNRILKAPTRSANWPVWLAYDTDIRKRAVQQGLDVSQFQTSIWNDVEAGYIARRVYDGVAKQIQQDFLINPSTSHGGGGTNNTSRGGGSRANGKRPSNLSNNSAVNSSMRADHASGSFRSPTTSGNPNHPLRCFICGDTSPDHRSRFCTATKLINGADCHIRKRAGDSHRKDSGGKSYCFAWNGFAGCLKGINCSNGIHSCSLCGNQSHNAQTCPAI